MSDIDNDTLKVLAIFIMIGMLVFVVLFAFSAGCMTHVVKPALGITPVPTATKEPIVVATETPFPINTVTTKPTAIPTYTKEEYIDWMKKNGGLQVGEWYQWYREDVSGKQDMIIRATVYDYHFMNNFHIRDFSWGSRATKLETNYPGYKFLFVLIHVESIGTSDRTYGFGPDHFVVQINNTIIAPKDEYNPEWIIKETEGWWDRYHIEAPKAYGYLWTQEAGSGIITAKQLEWLENGQPWDGYMIFEIPQDVKPEDIKILGRFDNVGGSAWWQLGYL